MFSSAQPSPYRNATLDEIYNNNKCGSATTLNLSACIPPGTDLGTLTEDALAQHIINALSKQVEQLHKQRKTEIFGLGFRPMIFINNDLNDHLHVNNIFNTAFPKLNFPEFTPNKILASTNQDGQYITRKGDQPYPPSPPLTLATVLKGIAIFGLVIALTAVLATGVLAATAVILGGAPMLIPLIVAASAVAAFAILGLAAMIIEKCTSAPKAPKQKPSSVGTIVTSLSDAPHTDLRKMAAASPQSMLPESPSSSLDVLDEALGILETEAAIRGRDPIYGVIQPGRQ